MKRVVIISLVGSLLMGSSMSGWNNHEEEVQVKAQKAEQTRLCRVYTDKIKKYKQTMRDDELARATLNNYLRLQKKFCTRGNK